MFSEMRYIDKAFRHIRLFGACFLVVCAGITAIVCGYCARLIKQASERVYVLEGGQIREARASERADNLGIEARDHVRAFHADFYGLDPDPKSITRNINRALYLADVSAKQEYDLLMEQHYYRNIVSANVSQRVQVDSVAVDTRQEPYYFHCWMTLTIIRASVTVTRRMETEGKLRCVSRSDNNPHGFLIEDWQIVSSTDVNPH